MRRRRGLIKELMLHLRRDHMGCLRHPRRTGRMTALGTLIRQEEWEGVIGFVYQGISGMN